MSLLDYICLAALAYVSFELLSLRQQRGTAKRRAAESEERFEQLFEDVPLACLEIDLEGVIRRANQKLCDLRGLGVSDIVGKPYADFAPEGDRERVAEEIRKKLSGAVPLIPGKQTFVGRDGEVVTVKAHETLLKDSDGAIVGLRSAALDVSEHLRKEEEIWQTTGELKAIFQALPDVFMRLDTDGLILDYRGPRTTTFLGQAREAVGRRFQSLVPAEAGRQIEKAIARVRKTNTMVAIEYSLPGGDEEAFFEARLLPLHWKEFIVIVRDITERKRADKRLEQYADEVREKNDDLAKALATAREATLLKGRFLANMSHEIRTPMNGVVGMTELLLGTTLTGEQREYAEAVQYSAGALLTITNDILDLSKIEAGRLTIESIPFDVTAVLKEVTGWFAIRAKSKGLSLDCVLPSDKALPVRGDPVRLRQILTNLVGNAIKFTETGRISVRMEAAGSTPESRKLRFQVEDTGIGIPPEQRSRLFESFTQGDDSMTRKYGGTGLGLAISKQLVELLGGDIGFESEPGRGSTFWFTAVFEEYRAEEAARVPATVQDVAPAPPAPVAAPAVPEVRPVEQLDGMRVLLVTGGAAAPGDIGEALTSWGCKVDQMSGVAWIVPELRLAAQSDVPFHLALLDLDLPDLDTSIGIEIAKDNLAFNTALIAMTSAPWPPDDAQLRERGFSACLQKPVLHAELNRALASVWHPGAAPAAALFIPPTAATVTDRRAPAAQEPAERVPRVPLAEDNLVNQMLVMRLLEKAGLQADVVSNGSQAVAAIGKTTYDLILMDCQMPEMDGFEATAEIRRLEGNDRHTTICALTAHAMAGDRERCLDAGMDDYISKPLTVGVLHKKIAHWIYSKQESNDGSELLHTA
jgi:two-component system sensor histidine kinase/response regulator